MKMDSKENAKIRSLILDNLYENEINNPGRRSNVSRDEMLKYLNISEKADISKKLMDFNIYYLKDKHLITLTETINSPWTSAKITASGIDKVERTHAQR